MDDRKPRSAHRLEQVPRRRDRAAQFADVVAEQLAKPARLQKIALHIDDEERADLRLEIKGIRFGRKMGHRRVP